jgi:methionyl-tRNA formyltransferase
VTLRIVFAGTPAFALPSLEALFHSSYKVVAVYTQPDRPAGRGKKIQMGPIKAFAMKHRIPIFQPENFKSTQVIEQLAALNPDLMIVAAYGLILPKAVLNIPRLGCVNVHASLLPRWRGASPIQYAILSGDLKTGITLMQMDEGLDTGDILSTFEVDILKTETFASLHDKLAQVGAQALMDLLPNMENYRLTPLPQDNRLATYAPKIRKTDAKIDWKNPANIIEQQIRALNPYPIAHTTFKGQTLRIYKAEIVQCSSVPGTIFVMQGYPIVATTDGGIKLIKVQMPGKKPVTGRDFVNAYLNSKNENDSFKFD